VVFVIVEPFLILFAGAIAAADWRDQQNADRRRVCSGNGASDPESGTASRL
jgi:hypothetical protein